MIIHDPSKATNIPWVTKWKTSFDKKGDGWMDDDITLVQHDFFFSF